MERFYFLEVVQVRPGHEYQYCFGVITEVVENTEGYSYRVTVAIKSKTEGVEYKSFKTDGSCIVHLEGSPYVKVQCVDPYGGIVNA